MSRVTSCILSRVASCILSRVCCLFGITCCLGLPAVQGFASCLGCCLLSRILPPVWDFASYLWCYLLSSVCLPARVCLVHLAQHTMCVCIEHCASFALPFWKANSCRRTDARIGIDLDYTAHIFRQISDRRTLNCKHPGWPESSAMVPYFHFVSAACQHCLSASQVVPNCYVKHLLNVETCLYCPQAFLRNEIPLQRLWFFRSAIHVHTHDTACHITVSL